MLDYTEELKNLYRRDDVPKTLTLTFPDVTITNTNIETESMVLEESLCSEADLVYGSCEASLFEITVYGIESSLITVGTTFSVTQTLGSYTNPIGTYTVESCTRVDDFGRRKIVAYDNMKKSDVDVSTWYNALTFNNSLTLKVFRESLLTHLGIGFTSQDLPNDSVIIEKTINPTYLLGRDVLRAICELNCGFGHVGRDGIFHVIQLVYQADAGETFTSARTDAVTTTREEYTVSAITGVWIREEDGDVGSTVGTDTNVFIIENNFLLFGKSATVLNTIASTLLSNMAIVTYIPAVTKCNGFPWIEVGDTYANNKCSEPIESYVFRRRMTGIQALRDEYTATGNEKRENVQSFATKFEQLKSKTMTIEGSVEGLEIEVTDFEQSTRASLELLTDSISTKVSKGSVISEINQSAEQVAIIASKISLTGYISANQNFQIDSSGNMIIVDGNTRINTNNGFLALHNDYDDSVLMLNPNIILMSNTVGDNTTYTIMIRSSEINDGLATLDFFGIANFNGILRMNNNIVLTTDDIGVLVAEFEHNHTKSQITDFPSAMPPTEHSQPASTITAGTLPAGVVATNGTDYTTSRLRNIQAGTSDMTAGTTALASGAIYVMYE